MIIDGNSISIYYLLIGFFAAKIFTGHCVWCCDWVFCLLGLGVIGQCFLFWFAILYVSSIYSSTFDFQKHVFDNFN